jgi:hypothetical protein
MKATHLLVGLIILAGCVSPRESLQPSLTQQIHPGQTRAAVIQLLGNSNWSQTGANGKTVDVYVYDELVYATRTAAESARDLKMRTFSVRYDPAGTVEETLVYESLTPATVYNNRSFAGVTVKPLDLQRIHIGTTTRHELEAMFGLPVSEYLHPQGGRELSWFQIETGMNVTHRQDARGLYVAVDRDGIVRIANYNDTAERR